jgi:hypothetical protein
LHRLYYTVVGVEIGAQVLDLEKDMARSAAHARGTEVSTCTRFDSAERSPSMPQNWPEEGKAEEILW